MYVYLYVIGWDAIGGLTHHIKALKEMVIFPLIYPEVYQRFDITPPRGVIFYGPPGYVIYPFSCIIFNHIHIPRGNTYICVILY